MRPLTISVVLAAISMMTVSSTRGFSGIYYTTIRNGTDAQIELNPDLKYSRELYVVAPHSSLAFLGGLSTVGFSIHTGARLLFPYMTDSLSSNFYVSGFQI